MSLLSELSKLQNFHEAGEGASVSSVEKYGTPARSLYTSLNLGSLHQQITVTDDGDRVLYTTKSSVFSLFGKTEILDADGTQVAHLEKRPVSLHEKHFITMADGRQITLSNELFHLVKDVTNIEGLDWKLEGNILGLNFVLKDENGEPVAVIGQKALSIHDKYCIDLYKPEHEKTVVAIVIALEKMLEARRESS